MNAWNIKTQSPLIYLKICIIFCLFLSAQVTLSLATETDDRTMSGIITKVEDGDTVWVKDPDLGKTVKVRLMGIDAPELNQAFGPEARDHLRKLVHGKKIWVEKIAIRSTGTVLGKILYKGEDLNLNLIGEGFAWHDVNQAPIQPNDIDRNQYSLAERFAKERKQGLWSLSKSPESPWAFRTHSKKTK